VTWRRVPLILPPPPAPDEPLGALYRSLSQVMAQTWPPVRLAEEAVETFRRELGIDVAVLVERRGLRRLGLLVGQGEATRLVGVAREVVPDDGELWGLEDEAGAVVAVLHLPGPVWLAASASHTAPAALAAFTHSAGGLRLAAATVRLDAERRRAEQLARALELGVRLGEGRPAARWELLARLARRVVGVGTVVVREHVGSSLVLRATAGGEELGLAPRIEDSYGVAGFVLYHDLGVLVGSMDPGVGDPPEALRFARGAVPSASAVVVPLRGLDGVRGTLSALSVQPFCFDDTDRVALERLGSLQLLWEATDRQRLAGGTVEASRLAELAAGLGLELELNVGERRWRFGALDAKGVADTGDELVVDVGIHQLVRVRGLKAHRDELARILAEHADRDPLTGVWHRQAFLARVQSWREAHSRPRRAALVVVDVDLLTEVNAKQGLYAGDRLLVATAAALLRVGDDLVVGRLGGDEFGVVVELQGAIDSLEAARQRVVAELARDGIVVSIAVVPLGPVDSLSAQLALAEEATYADEARRGVARSERSEVRPPASDLLRAPELLRALGGDTTAGSIRAVLQPVIELVTGEIVGVEALARWQHPRHGTIAPKHFLPLAVQLRAVERVDDAVRRAALASLRQLEAAGLARGLRVSFNLSAHTARRRGVAHQLLELIAEYEFTPDRVVVELTESEIESSSLQQLRRNLEVLDNAGVVVALDDFGVGTSSFRHLAALPVRELKVDRSFVRQLVSGQGTALVEGLVALANRLGLELVAEGVEDAATARLLVDLGVRRAQGFHFHRPLSPGALARLLRQRTDPRGR